MSSMLGRMTWSELSKPMSVNPLRVSSCGTPLSAGSSWIGITSCRPKVWPASIRSLSIWRDGRAKTSADKVRQSSRVCFIPQIYQTRPGGIVPPMLNYCNSDIWQNRSSKRGKILNIYIFYPCSVSKKLLILARRCENGDKKQKNGRTCSLGI